jgi:hypothetical protein
MNFIFTITIYRHMVSCDYNKFDTIKEFKKISGLGLKTSKEIIEVLENTGRSRFLLNTEHSAVFMFNLRNLKGQIAKNFAVENIEIYDDEPFFIITNDGQLIDS